MPRKNSTPAVAAAIATNTHSVTRPPPNRSESPPVSEREAAPTSGPRKAKASGSTPGNCVLVKSGNPAEKPMKEPKVPYIEPAHDPGVLALEDDGLLLEG